MDARTGAQEKKIKKIIIGLFIIFQVFFLYAEKEYLSTDGYYFYYFADDFSEFKYTTLDEYGIFSDVSKISCKNKNGITFWTINNKDYILFMGERFFILMNNENNYKFIKDYSDNYTNTEKVAIYEASSYKRIGINHYDEFNLLYINFQPWISDSDNTGIDEYIIIETQTNFSSFRIINGFIDFNNPQYFEEFNKVKELSVFDMNNNLIGKYKIENNSTIQSFYLPGKFTKIKFIISEIYEGTKYDDIAITTLQCY